MTEELQRDFGRTAGPGRDKGEENRAKSQPEGMEMHMETETNAARLLAVCYCIDDGAMPRRRSPLCSAAKSHRFATG